MLIFKDSVRTISFLRQYLIVLIFLFISKPFDIQGQITCPSGSGLNEHFRLKKTSLSIYVYWDKNRTPVAKAKFVFNQFGSPKKHVAFSKKSGKVKIRVLPNTKYTIYVEKDSILSKPFKMLARRNEESIEVFMDSLSSNSVSNYRNPESIAVSNFIYVVDVSGSMKYGKLRAVKWILFYLISNHQQSDRIMLVSYATNALIEIEPNAISLAKSNEVIDRLVAEGQTNISEALVLTYKLLKPINGGKNIVVISDFAIHGQINQQWANIILSNNSGISLSTIGLNQQKNIEICSKLSRQFKGESVYLKTTDPRNIIRSTIRNKLMAAIFNN